MAMRSVSLPRVFVILILPLTVFFYAEFARSAIPTDLPPDQLPAEELKKVTGGCAQNPYPLLRERYKPGAQSSREGANGINRLNGDFACRLAKFLAKFPGACINSAYRSPETQAILFRNAVAKYGSEAAARKWVAPPGNSMHNKGLAADLCNLPANAKAEASKERLTFRMGHEPWHIEPNGAVSGSQPDGGRSAPSSPLSTAIRNAVNPQPAMQSPPAQPLPQQLPQQTPTASAPPPLGTPNTTPYQPGTCAPQFYCSNNNLYYRTSSCVDQINQVCTKGCSGTSCIDTPVSTDLLTALLSTSTRPATTTGKKTATATPSVFEQLSAFAGPTVVTVTTNVATSVDLTGLYGQGVMTLNGVPQTQTAPGTPGNSYQLAPPGSQQTFISPDLGQSAGTYTNPPQQSTFQKTLADMKAVVLRILEYLRPFGRSGGVDNYPESE